MLNWLEIPRRVNAHLHPVCREGDAELFVRLQCRTRHLFAISQRRITEQDSTATLVMADNSLTHFVDDGLGKLWEER